MAWLYRRYVNKSATREERAEFRQLLLKAEFDPELRALLEETWKSIGEEEKVFDSGQSQNMLGYILAQEAETGRTDPGVGGIAKLLFMGRRFRMAVAVCALLLISGIVVFINRKSGFDDNINLTGNNTYKTDIGPGQNGAILTLADGTQIELDSVANGVIAHEEGTNLELKDGKLVYSSSETDIQAEELRYNVLTTPRGRQFNLILPDGSQVWLNAASSIRYPLRFGKNNRIVEIKGEAYFEITPDKTKPFLVHRDGVEVEVLGTHFNVNSYADEEDIKVTLIEGSVKVKSSGGFIVLKPGQQARISENQMVILENQAESALAWKKGLFYFDKANIQAVMRQLEKWYNVEIEYEGAISKREFQGEIQRELNLSEVLDVLRRTDVNFRVEGRKLIVMP